MVLFGERHSGTNLVEYVLSRSCSTAFYPPEAYGFKHWWLNERENSSRVSLIATQLLVPVIFIVREPIAWMMAMAKRPHHNPRPNLPLYTSALAFLRVALPIQMAAHGRNC